MKRGYIPYDVDTTKVTTQLHQHHNNNSHVYHRLSVYTGTYGCLRITTVYLRWSSGWNDWSHTVDRKLNS